MKNRKYLFPVIFIIGLLFIGAIFFFTLKKKPVASIKKEISPTASKDSFNVRALTDLKFERTDIRKKRGEYLTNSILQCFTCHSPRDWKASGAPPIEAMKGSGGTVLVDDTTMHIEAPNITPDAETGAGTWTDDMFVRAIREGVGHDGRVLYYQMPYFIFRSLSDEDLASVIVYLRTLPAIHHVVTPTRMSATDKKNLQEFVKPINLTVPTPDLSDSIKRGKYLVRIGECVGCHTSHSDNNPGLFAGGNHIERFGITSFSANITTDSSGIGYGVNGFIFVIRTGKGGLLSPIMPWASFKNLTDSDLKDIYSYLQTLPTSQHYVNSQKPFTHCSICGMDHGMGDRNKVVKYTGIKLDPKKYSLYTGTYKNDEFNEQYIIEKKGNKLVGRHGEKAPVIELIPQSDSFFLAPGWPVPITFRKDTNGKMTQIAESTDYGAVFKKIK